MKTKIMLKLHRLYALCPVRHTLLCLSAVTLCFHALLRPHREIMRFLSARLVRPLHALLSGACALVPFSVAELLIGVFSVGVAGVLLYALFVLFRREQRGQRLYRAFLSLLTAAALVYTGFSFLWGVFYYGDDFLMCSGLTQREISVEELRDVTAYFAALASEGAEQVERDEEGRYCASRSEILARSGEVYTAVEEEFPCLAGPARRAKGVYFSRILSYTDFTGFFFPFTGEANVNTDFPMSLFASTVAHELSHQRAVAKEQEANFTAVLACMACDDADYRYSGALLAYIHLSNALYDADYAAWEEIFLSLSPLVVSDLRENSAYWAQFETPVETVSSAVYEGFLKSYDQTLGLKSYGACVDLIVNYFSENAK